MMHDTTTGRTEGERLKMHKLALLEAHREVYVLRGRRALLDAAIRSGTATADDVRSAVTLPSGIDPRCLGSVPGLLARAGIIRRADFRKSGRAERHASYITVWELANAEAAERWLATHPDVPDPSDDDQGEYHPGVLFDSHETAAPTVPAAGAAL